MRLVGDAYIAISLKKTRLWFLAILYAILLIQISLDDFKVMPTEIGGLYYFWISPYLDAGVTILMILLTSIAGVSILIEDWNSGMILYSLNRMTLNQYVKQLLIRTMSLSAFVPTLGLILYSLIIITKFPLVGEFDSYLLKNAIDTLLNGHLLATDYYIFFYLFLLLNVVYNHVIYVFLAVLLSVSINNKYIIMVAPTFIYTIFSLFVNNNWLSVILNPLEVFGFYSWTEIYFKQLFGEGAGTILGFVYPTLYFLVLLFGISLLIQYSLRRKLRKGVSWGGGMNADV